MPKFYISLVNLEVEAENADEAGTIGSLDIVTLHIMEFLSNEFQMVVTNQPIRIDAPPAYRGETK